MVGNCLWDVLTNVNGEHLYAHLIGCYDFGGGGGSFSGNNGGYFSGGGESGGGTGGGGSSNGNTGAEGDLDLSITDTPVGINKPCDKDQIVECIDEDNLTQAQQDWLSNPDNAFTVKVMANMINYNKCHVMSDIIQDYLDNPNVPFDEFVEDILECYGLDTLTNNIDFNNAIDDLENFIANNEEDEQGYEVSNTNNTIGTNFVAGDWQGVVLGYGNNIIGGMHTHPDQGYPMFSAQDIYTLYNYYKQVSYNPNVSQNDVFLTLTTQGDNQIDTFMIKIKDFTMLNFIVQTYQLSPSNRKAMRLFNQKLNSDYRQNSDINDYMRELLETFEDIKAEYNMPKTPLYLYKLNTSTNTFEKVKLNGSNPPIKTPCN